MPLPESTTTHRRDWLRTAARAVALGALGGGGALLVARNGRWAGGCPRELACAGCPVLAHCILPQRRGPEWEEFDDE